MIKFDDNTNDLVDFVFAADGIFSNTRSFFEKKKKTSQNAIQIINVNVQLEDCIVKKKKSTWYFEIIHSTSN